MSKLAIWGGTPVKKTPYPEWPVYNDQERNTLNGILDSRLWWRTPGSQTLQFERAFAKHHDAAHGIAITNGTAALEVAFAALGIGPGDEVIVPDYTFVATASAVLFTGALPVLVDITPDTFCIDPDLVEAAIKPATKAIAAVHMGGHPADLDRLLAIAKKHDLFLIEDSAHAHGGEWRGTKVGAQGDLGTFSFQQSKLMTAGEGGIIITNDDNLEIKLRSVHDCGRMPDEWFYSHFRYGGNYRLSEWQGGILRHQLERLDKQAEIRTRNAALLRSWFNEIDGITPQRLDDRCTRHGYYAFIFHYDKAAFGDKPASTFIEALDAEGFPTQASYPPLHDLDLFTSGAYRARLPAAEQQRKHAFLKAPFSNTLKAAWETVWLPNPLMLSSEKELSLVVDAILKIQAGFTS